MPPSLASLGADSVSTAYGRLATLLDAEKRHGIKGTMVAHFFSPGSSGVSSAQGEWLAVRGPGKRAPHSWLPPLFCARPSADPPLAAPPPPRLQQATYFEHVRVDGEAFQTARPSHYSAGGQRLEK